jgi:hypothetical protein
LFQLEDAGALLQSLIVWALAEGKAKRKKRAAKRRLTTEGLPRQLEGGNGMRVTRQRSCRKKTLMRTKHIQKQCKRAKLILNITPTEYPKHRWR